MAISMSASDWTMQFLADMRDAPVDRPEVLETAAGAISRPRRLGGNADRLSRRAGMVDSLIQLFSWPAPPSAVNARSRYRRAVDIHFI
jgi:hypothetical protein